jgi:hypothetical protein
MQKWVEGLLRIEQNTQTGWVKTIESLGSGQGILKVDAIRGTANAKLSTSPFNFLSEFSYGMQIFGNSKIDTSVISQSFLPFAFKTDGNANVLKGVNPDGMLDTFSIMIELDNWSLRPSLPTSAFLQDSAPLISGFINLEITKLLTGTMYTQEAMLA